MTFGMYKGSEIIQVIKENPQYLDWCMQRFDSFKLSRKAKNKLIKSLKSQRCNDVYDEDMEADVIGSIISPYGGNGF